MRGFRTRAGERWKGRMVESMTGVAPRREHKREAETKGQEETKGLDEVEGQSSWV